MIHIIIDWILLFIGLNLMTNLENIITDVIGGFYYETLFYSIYSFSTNSSTGIAITLF